MTYTATRLKTLALHWLRRNYPDALLTCELALASFGASSVDVAAVDARSQSESRLVGVEVKGDGDSAARLELQGPAYAMAASEMWLLPAPSLAKASRKKAPYGWGLLRLGDDGAVEIERRGPYAHDARAVFLDGNAPDVLAGVLWREEAARVARDHKVPVRQRQSGSGPTKADYVDALVAALPLPTLREAVIQALYYRDWEGARHRDNRAIPPNKIVWRPGDALPAFGEGAPA